MVTYPISVRRKQYRGSVSKERLKVSAYNQAAAELETYINGLLLQQESPIQVYLWYQISQGCGMSSDKIAELGMSIDGGSNGFTAWRHDLTYEQAMEMTRSLGQ